MRHYFDFSNYPKDHPLYDTSKKKVPGYFKDELGVVEMTEFIALRSKMYAYRTKDNDSKKLKGIAKIVVRRNISFDDYVDCLEKSRSFYHKMRHLRSDKHQIYLEEVDKKSLSHFDDKRFILEDGISTLPFGMYYEGYMDYSDSNSA